MTVKKGPYWAEEGDFASAGSLRLAYLDRLESNVVQGTGGSFGHWRGLAAGTMPLGNGWLTAAAESVLYNGAWDIPDNLRKFNGFLRYSEARPPTAFPSRRSPIPTPGTPPTRVPCGPSPMGASVSTAGIDPTDGGDDPALFAVHELAAER